MKCTKAGKVTVCESTGLVDPAFAASPLYCATTLEMPTGSLDQAQLALPLLTATVQIELPLAVKLTVPVGDLPVTVAVNVTLVPATVGLREVAKVVLVAVSTLEEIWTVASVDETVGTLMVN